MLQYVVAHAAGPSTTTHAVVDTAVGVLAGVVIVAVFYLWLRYRTGRDGRSGL